MAELAAEYGTPLYVYSQRHILGRLEMFERGVRGGAAHGVLCAEGEQLAGADPAAGRAWGGVRYRLRRGAGEGAEGGAAGAGQDRLAGVGKQAAEIDAALGAGILLFNVESPAELETIAARSEALGQGSKVFAAGESGCVCGDASVYLPGLSAHKFGIDIKQARALYRKAAKSKWLQAAGVSVHIGSQIRAVDPFGAALERVAELIGQLRSDGIALSYIDAGGGLGIEYGEKEFDPEAAVAAYAKQVMDATRELGLHLLLEPGRFLVAQAGALLTTVLNVKKNGDKTFVIVDAAMNDLIRPALYQAHHQIVPVKQGSGGATVDGLTVDIVGPVCESGDFLRATGRCRWRRLGICWRSWMRGRTGCR